MPTVALAHIPQTPFTGGLIFFGIVVWFVAYLVWERRRYPWVPRRGCNGTGVRRSPWSGAIGPCRKRSHRDGNHMRRRWGAGPG